MKITQYNAISVDGFIDDANGSSDWVSQSDWQEFARYVKEKKAIIMGRKTYEAGLEAFPYDCELNVVMTTDQNLIETMKDDKRVWFVNEEPQNIIEELKNRGYEECLIIGGGNINSQFLEQNLLNELVLSVHPLILGKGLKLFEGNAVHKHLELVSVKTMDEGLVQQIYRVIG